MTPRGEVGLIVALVGLQMAVISAQTYALLVFMTVATTLAAPSLMKLVFQEDCREPAAREVEHQRMG